MPRYPHFLARVGEGHWPDTVVCVDCKTLVERDPYRDGRQFEALTSWHAEILCASNRDYYKFGEYSDRHSEDWWKVLECIVADAKNTLILSYQCGRIWSLLDFWGKLETGHVAISCGQMERAYRYKDTVLRLRQSSNDPLRTLPCGSLSQMLRNDTGLLVTEDPPSIARFTIGSGKHKVCWIDCRNHGADINSGINKGAGTASELARWFVEYARLLRKYKLGSIRATGGSQAFNGFRHGYYTGGIYVHTDKRATEAESGSYHGGRSECFRMGAIRVPSFHVDVRSMYPAICAVASLPARLRHCHPRYSQLEYERRASGTGVIATVTVETPEPAYPRVYQGNTIWPTGKFRCTLAGPELEDAVRLGRVVSWHDACEYDLTPVLRDYANAVYQARCESEIAQSAAVGMAIKKLLVCLPGKFAQRLRVWEDAPGVVPVVRWGEWWGSGGNGEPCRYRSIGGFVQRDIDLGFGGETNPAIASWITSMGRVILLEAIRTAGWEEVYYCDTDSLILSECGYDRMCEHGLVENKTLGKWQIVARASNVHIYGIKHYTYNNKLVCAGLPKGCCTDAGDGIHYWYQRSPSWAIESGQKPTAERVLKPYARNGIYQHGVVQPGGRVKPIELRED